MQLLPFVMIYTTLIAVFTTLNYFLALSGGLKFSAKTKESTVLESFYHTVTHVTFGTSNVTPLDELAMLVTAVMRLCSLAVFVAIMLTGGKMSTNATTSTPVADVAST